jgi:chromosome partitioning protein
MPKYIAVVNQKGGVGKTSTCVNLCAALELQGYKILAVDADQQKSLTDWMNLADPPRFTFGVIEMCHAQLHRKLPEIADAANYDFVVVDCPPGGQDRSDKDDISRSAIVLADMVLVPLQPGPLDFLAVGRLKKLLVQACTYKPELLIAVLISRRKASGRMSRTAGSEAGQFLAEAGLNLKILESEIYERTVIAEAVVDGASVIGYTPKQKSAREAVEKATAEYLNLSKEIAKCLMVVAPSAASITAPLESAKRPNGAC